MIRPVTCPACGCQFNPDITVESSHDAYDAMVIGGMSVREYARDRGIAPATAMLYRRCGIALRALKVQPDSELFKSLVRDATANRAEIAAEIQRPGATRKTLAALLKTTPPQPRTRGRVAAPRRS